MHVQILIENMKVDFSHLLNYYFFSLDYTLNLIVFLQVLTIFYRDYTLFAI